jgi:hypothetical protein
MMALPEIPLMSKNILFHLIQLIYLHIDNTQIEPSLKDLEQFLINFYSSHNVPAYLLERC